MNHVKVRSTADFVDIFSIYLPKMVRGKGGRFKLLLCLHSQTVAFLRVSLSNVVGANYQVIVHHTQYNGIRNSFSGAEQLKSSNSSRSKRQFLEMFVNLDVNIETFNLYKTFVFLNTCLACDYELINI